MIDLNDKDVIFKGTGGIGFDTEGNVMTRLGPNTACDLKTGKIHMVSGWTEEEEDEEKEE